MVSLLYIWLSPLVPFDILMPTLIFFPSALQLLLVLRPRQYRVMPPIWILFSVLQFFIPFSMEYILVSTLRFGDEPDGYPAIPVQLDLLSYAIFGLTLALFSVILFFIVDAHESS